ncbi:MAG: peptide deformylase [Minisyncoccia bacterium]|jgi:peptide deformylase
MKDPIVQAGALILRQKAKPVAKKDVTSPAIKKIIARMKKALSKEDFGVAIAAPQIGESLRMFVISGRVFEEKELSEERSDLSAHPPQSSALYRRSRPGHFSPPDLVFINPELTRLSRKQKEKSEGCLSVRGKYGTVMRHEKATVKALNETGKPFIYHASGLLAHIFQHECDHLEGILYTDKAIKLTDDKVTDKEIHEH